MAIDNNTIIFTPGSFNFSTDQDISLSETDFIVEDDFILTEQFNLDIASQDLIVPRSNDDLSYALIVDPTISQATNESEVDVSAPNGGYSGTIGSQTMQSVTFSFYGLRTLSDEIQIDSDSENSLNFVAGDLNVNTFSLERGVLATSAPYRSIAGSDFISTSSIGGSDTAFVPIESEPSIFSDASQNIQIGERIIYLYGNDTISGSSFSDKISGDVRSTLYGVLGASTEISINQSSSAQITTSNSNNMSSLSTKSLVDATVTASATIFLNNFREFYGDDYIVGGMGDDTLTGDLYEWVLVVESIESSVEIQNKGETSIESINSPGIDLMGDISSNAVSSIISSSDSLTRISKFIINFGDDSILGQKGDDFIIGDVKDVFWDISSNDISVSSMNSASATADAGTASATSNILIDATDKTLVSGNSFVFGNDSIKGGDGGDTIVGDTDNIIIIADVGETITQQSDDTMSGGSGVTSANATTNISDVESSVVILNNSFTFGNDEIFGYQGDDIIIGDLSFVDTFVNENVNDRINKFEFGNDRIIGGVGDDTLIGDALELISLFPGLTNSVIVGHDRFDFYDNEGGFGRDVIVDFQSIDRINLRAFALSFDDITSNSQNTADGVEIDVGLASGNQADTSTIEIMGFSVSQLQESFFILD